MGIQSLHPLKNDALLTPNYPPVSRVIWICTPRSDLTTRLKPDVWVQLA